MCVSVLKDRVINDGKKEPTIFFKLFCVPPFLVCFTC